MGLLDISQPAGESSRTRGWPGSLLLAVRGSLWRLSFTAGLAEMKKTARRRCWASTGRRVCQRGTARKDFEPVKLISLRGLAALIWIRAAIRP
jgi:hypothetical protein